MDDVSCLSWKLRNKSDQTETAGESRGEAGDAAKGLCILAGVVDFAPISGQEHLTPLEISE